MRFPHGSHFIKIGMGPIGVSKGVFVIGLFRNYSLITRLHS